MTDSTEPDTRILDGWTHESWPERCRDLARKCAAVRNDDAAKLRAARADAMKAAIRDQAATLETEGTDA